MGSRSCFVLVFFLVKWRHGSLFLPWGVAVRVGGMFVQHRALSHWWQICLVLGVMPHCSAEGREQDTRIPAGLEVRGNQQGLRVPSLTGCC